MRIPTKHALAWPYIHHQKGVAIGSWLRRSNSAPCSIATRRRPWRQVRTGAAAKELPDVAVEPSGSKRATTSTATDAMTAGTTRRVKRLIRTCERSLGRTRSLSPFRPHRGWAAHVRHHSSSAYSTRSSKLTTQGRSHGSRRTVALGHFAHSYRLSGSLGSLSSHPRGHMKIT